LKIEKKQIKNKLNNEIEYLARQNKSITAEKESLIEKADNMFLSEKEK
jgi:hypothetical protein